MKKNSDPMAAASFLQLLDLYPSVRPVLLKICKRYQKRQVLSGTMKLGHNLEGAELAAVQACFGMRPLSISKAGDVRLSFDRFFQEMSAEQQHGWVLGLHEALGMVWQERRETDYGEQASRMLERLRLAYPELGRLHDHLAEQCQEITARYVRHGRAVQERYFLAAEIIRFLQENETPVTFSELGAKFCNDSKALRNTELMRFVQELLEVLDAEWPEHHGTVWERYHVVKDRLTVQVTIFGPLVYEKSGTTYRWIEDLWRAGEPATLNWANIQSMDRLYPSQAGHCQMLTCENEAPFAGLIRQKHPGILLYSGGFPNDAVLALYRLLAPAVDRRRHWGDSDLAGLRIAAIFHGIRSTELWRCELATLKQHQSGLLPLTNKQRSAISATLEKNPDFPFTDELRFTLKHGWLEQERWQS